METTALLVLVSQIVGSSAAIALSVSALRTYVLPKLPRAAYPLLAYSLGLFAEYLFTVATGDSDPVRAGFIMAGSHILREWVNTFQEHGATGK